MSTNTNTNPIKARSALFDAIVESNEAVVVNLLNNSPLKDPGILNQIYDTKIRPYTLYDIALDECKGRDNNTHPQCKIKKIMRQKGAMSIYEIFAKQLLEAINSPDIKSINEKIQTLPSDYIDKILKTKIVVDGHNYDLLDYTEYRLGNAKKLSILKAAIGEPIPLQVPKNSSVLYGPGGIPLYEKPLTGAPTNGIAAIGTVKRKVGPLKITGGKRKKTRKTRRRRRH